MSKTIIKAEQHNADSVKWSTWTVEYKEFSGRYFLSDAEYRLQMKIQELVGKVVTEQDIDDILDLKHEADEHDRAMEECD